ncbi:MAG: hypothetical protein HFH24_00905 [Ruminococcus sp.]|nr:hypothetical protein [Ruminococcus sp.]
MIYEDEKDYLMRMIKEMVRVLFSLLLGKQYTQVDVAPENKYSVSGTDLDDLKKMIDCGKINEAENLLLENLNYNHKEELAAAVLFYEYISRQEESFLEAHEYSLEEAMDGLKQIVKNSGYEEFFPQ